MGEVTPLGQRGRGGPKDPGHERWLRRQALLLGAQLPDNLDDALRIVQLMEALLRTFLNEPSQT